LKIHPMVVRKDGKMRIGKGFSKGELKEAGIVSKQALRLTIPVDLRRNTKHEENVDALKQYLGLRVPKISKPPEPTKKLPKPVKTKVAEKPTRRKKAPEVSKPLKRAKAPKATKTEKPAPKKTAARRKAAKSKGEEKA